MEVEYKRKEAKYDWLRCKDVHPYTLPGSPRGRDKNGEKDENKEKDEDKERMRIKKRIQKETTVKRVG